MDSLYPKSNRIICVMALFALNLGVLMLVAQMRIPLDDTALDQAREGRVPLSTAGKMAAFRFPSCSAGNSINCHTRGNRAGL